MALRDRCESEPMDSFVSAFLQAEELGAPLATTLTNIALDMRRESAQAARRKAARTVPRVTLVVSMVLVPPTLLLIAVGLYLGSDVDLGTVLETGMQSYAVAINNRGQVVGWCAPGDGGPSAAYLWQRGTTTFLPGTQYGGQARAVNVESVTQTSSIFGTAAYVAPEQAQDAHAADTRADVYSLGATLYFALTGRPPYMFDDLIQRFRGPGLAPPESLTEATGVPFPTDLEYLVARMLAHDRDARPRDFDELGVLLDDLRGTSICFGGAKARTSANDAPTVMVSTTDETLQEIPLQALMEVYVDAILEDHGFETNQHGLTVWGSASARRRRPFTVDGVGVVYAADQRCVVSTDRAGRPRDLHRAGRDGADISALAWSRDAVWSGTTDGHLVVVTDEQRGESGLPQPAAVLEIATDELGSVALVRSANGVVSLCRDHGKRWWGEVAHDARAIAVSPDGTRFACATRRGVEVGWMYDNAWEPAEIINTPAVVTSLAFLAHGELAVGDEDAAIWVYGGAGRNPRSHFLLPLEGPIELTASGEKLFACSCDDSGHILVRDVSPGEAPGWVHFS